MKIISTFVPSLYAFKFPDEEKDELARILSLWNDPFYLNDFLEENIKDLSVSIPNAITNIRSDSKRLRKKLIELTRIEPPQLNQLFKNLRNDEIAPKTLSLQKAPLRWLRLYAIRVDKHRFIITGGAIKLNGGIIAARKEFRMQDRSHTHEELKKLNRCKDYLHDLGVFDEDSFVELVILSL